MSALLGFAGRVLDTRERIPRVLSLVLPPNNQGAAITEDIAIVSLTGHKQTIRLHRHVYTASRLGHYDKCTARMLHSCSTSHSALPRLFLIPKLTIFFWAAKIRLAKAIRLSFQLLCTSIVQQFSLCLRLTGRAAGCPADCRSRVAGGCRWNSASTVTPAKKVEKARYNRSIRNRLPAHRLRTQIRHRDCCLVCMCLHGVFHRRNFFGVTSFLPECSTSR